MTMGLEWHLIIDCMGGHTLNETSTKCENFTNIILASAKGFGWGFYAVFQKNVQKILKISNNLFVKRQN